MHILNAVFTCSRLHSNQGGICSGPHHSCLDQNTYQDSRSSNRVCEAEIIIESRRVFAWYSVHCVDEGMCVTEYHVLHRRLHRQGMISSPNR